MPPKKRGPLGRWWEKQMQQAQAISEERKAGTAGGDESRSPAKASTTTATTKRSTSTAKAARPYARNSPKGRMLAEQARREAADESLEADIVAEDVQEADIPANGTKPGTPRRPRRGRK